MDKWIKQAGVCKPEELPAVVSKEISASDTILAYFSDQFKSCKGDQLQSVLQNAARLLEIRAFNDNQELWIHRSQLGTGFVWRVANEIDCEAKRDYIETVQALDIDETYDAFKNGETDEYGSLRIRSTVKGYYVLPIQKTDAFVKLFEYVRYDDAGIAGVVDYRVAGFTPSKKEDA